jgi:hypothetical protein
MASDAVDAARSAIPKGFKFLVVVIKRFGIQTFFSTTTYAAIPFF